MSVPTNSRAQASPPRDLNTHHVPAVPGSRSAWEARRSELRKQILFSAGLLPMPRRTPLRPRVVSRVERADFAVENVAIETMPGYLLCGNLYRPVGKKGPFPAIVNPHGHWANGRTEQQADVPLAPPAPGPMGDGRGNLVSIGVNLARQGFVVLAYDMVGYNDTNQASHRFGGNLSAWLWNVNLMGLQLWNSIRAVDYLCSLPDVDKSRIGATGASGGGTQTFLLAAIDERVRVSVPVNMVSAHMQGGCLCENGPGLRIDTDNVEIAAMAAPRPQLLIACTGDWTKNNPTEEWPAVRKVYELYRQADKTAVVQFNYGHNYNIESREAMYAWFGKWLQDDPVAANHKERPFEIPSSALRLWPEGAAKQRGIGGEAELTQALVDRGLKPLERSWPRDASGIAAYRRTVSELLRRSLAVPRASAARRASRPSSERAVLIVHRDGDPKAEQVAAEIGRLGLVHERLTLTPEEVSPTALWNAFYTCYNRSPLSEAVRRVSERACDLRRRYARVALVGLGDVGPATLLAGASDDVCGSIAADLAGADWSDDSAYLRSGLTFAPGLRRAGGMRAAAAACATGRVLLFNGSIGSAAMWDDLGSRCGGRLSLRPDPVDAIGIVRWLTTQ